MISKTDLTKLLIVIVLLAMSLLPGLWFLVYGKLPVAWLREDGFYEAIAAFALFAGSYIFVRAWLLSGKTGSGSRNTWLLVFSIALFFLAAEEISWGQRIIGFDVPESISSENFQEDFNIHNSKRIQSSNNYISGLLTQLLVAYLIILPIALRAFPSIGDVFSATRIPVPGLAIALSATLGKMATNICYRIIYGDNFSHDILHVGEAFESVLELCLLWLAVECFLRERNTNRDNGELP